MQSNYQPLSSAMANNFTKQLQCMLRPGLERRPTTIIRDVKNRAKRFARSTECTLLHSGHIGCGRAPRIMGGRMAQHTTKTEHAAEQSEKLYMENTLLRVFGALFCHDAKRARARTKPIEINKGAEE